MLNRFLIAGFLCFTGFFIYWWSIAFDEDLRSEKGSLPYYLLIPTEIKNLPLPDGYTDLRYHSFPGDGPSQPYDEVEFLLASNQMDAAVQMYENHISAQNCQRRENETFVRLSMMWKCAAGKYEFSASPDIVRNNAGEYIETDKHVVHVAYYGFQ